MNNEYFHSYYANEKIECYRREAEVERMLNQIKKDESDNQRLGCIPRLDVVLKAVLRVLHIGDELAGVNTSPKFGQS